MDVAPSARSRMQNRPSTLQSTSLDRYARQIHLALLAFIVVTVSCTQSGATTTTNATQPVDPSPTGTTTTTSRVTPPTSFGSAPPGDKLLVLVADLPAANVVNPDAGLVDGTITVGPTCITWNATGASKSVLLIWVEGSVRLEGNNTVVFTSPVDSTTHRLESGRKVDLGGVPATGTTDFISPPSDTCPSDAFLVLSARVGD